MYNLEDTICAIATPSGRGGIGIIRVSGSKAVQYAEKIFKGNKLLTIKRQFRVGKFIDPASGELLDEGLLLVMPSPHSYTGEDVVEFQVHGSPAVLSKMINILVELGARPAGPGEFTYRAFVHQRMDLTQAEAVEFLVSAQGEHARRQALKQFTGGLLAYLEPIEQSLKKIYSEIEARVEFPTEVILPIKDGEILEEVENSKMELQKLLKNYNEGKVLTDGLTVALIGSPNVGKSSLLNLILGRPRAIVNPVAGTTRDVVEGEIYLKGTRVRVFDTAGLRKTDDPIEAEGVQRSWKVIEEADVLFWILESSNLIENLEEIRFSNVPVEKTWILINKIDLLDEPNFFLETLKKKSVDHYPFLTISCLKKIGIDRVMEKIEKFIERQFSEEDVMIVSVRHRSEIKKSITSLNQLMNLINEKQTYDLWAEELKEAISSLGRIRGLNLSRDAFEEIFNRFCIGK